VSGAGRYEDACNIYAYGGAETTRHKPFDLSQDGMSAEQGELLETGTDA
jgi:hypothetical protein